MLCSLRTVFSAGLPSTLGSHTIQNFSNANELLLNVFLELHNAGEAQRNVDALRAGNFQNPYVSSWQGVCLCPGFSHLPDIHPHSLLVLQQLKEASGLCQLLSAFFPSYCASLGMLVNSIQISKEIYGKLTGKTSAAAGTPWEKKSMN